MKKILLLFLLFTICILNAQNITFISEKTGRPLPKVSVFGKDGSIIAFSDIAGTIDKQSLKPEQQKFQLVYADGIVTYIFDNKTKKLKDTRIEQYRIFRLERTETDAKNLSSWDYAMFLKVPKIKDADNINEYKKNEKYGVQGN